MSTLLTAVIKRIPRAPMFLYDLIVGNRSPVLSGNSKIRFQLFKAGKKLAPITTRTAGGVIMTHTGFTDWEMEAPLLGPMWDMSEAYETGAPGEDQWFSIDESGQAVQQTTANRVEAWRALRLAEGQEAIRRRIEWMLAQQLTTGSIVLTGRGGYSQTIDLGFDNTVSDLTAWDNASGDPIADLLTLRDEAANAGVPIPNVLVMASDTASAFVSNAKVKARLENNVSQLDPIFGQAPLNYPGAYRVGYIRELDVMAYAYGATYTSDAGATTSFIPTGRAVFFPSRERNEAMAAYGAIRDARDNRWYSGEYYVREFAGIDGHTEFLEVNSRPVACLCEVESWYSLSSLITPPGT